MQVNSTERAGIRRQSHRQFGIKHEDLLDKFSTAVGHLVRFRRWDTVPSDIAEDWRDLQAGLLEGKGLWLQARSWREPTPKETAGMWTMFSLLRYLPWPNDAKLILLASAGFHVRSLAKARSQSVAEVMCDLDDALAQIADAIAAEEAA